MKEELPHKYGWATGLVLITIFIAMVLAAIVKKKKKITEDTLIELYDPIESQEIKDFRNQNKDEHNRK